MLLVHGMYRLGRKRIGYRNDFCLACERENIAEQYRTFDVGHLFFVPALPLGYRKHWHCAACGSNPHERTRTSKTLIVLLAVVVGLMAALSWIGPLIPPPQDAAMFWSMRVIFLIGFAGLVYGIRHMKPVPGLKERLSSVTPLPGDSCLYCGGELVRHGFCGNCNLQRYAAGSTDPA